ncbi:MAG: DUF3187 family protein [Chthonomonadaceae bacterium]|nr:DUF3187 family protein [Chthonomonadaceae bacterium]
MAQGPQDFGPLATRNHRAPALPFLRFEPRFGVLRTGREDTVALTVANDFRDVSRGPLRVSEDQETTRLAWTQRQALGHGAEWGFELPFLSRGGGFLDPMIDWWHANVLHWSNPDRDAAPFGHSAVELPGSRTFGSASGIGDVSVFAAKAMGRDLVARAALKLPTGDPRRLMGSGGIDAGVMLDWRRPLGGTWTAFAGAGLVLQSPATELDGTRGWADQEYLALMHRANSRDEWIVQWQSERAPLSTGVPASDATHRLVTFAYRRRLDEGSALELFFSEDRDLFSGAWPEGANTGPDITVGVRFVTRR